MGGHDPVAAHLYVREFFQTVDCDNIMDMSEERTAVEQFCASYSDGRALHRVLRAEQTPQDKNVMQIACIHYHTLHTKQLMSALNGEQRIRYVTNRDRVLATFGLAADKDGPGWRAVQWAKQKANSPVSSNE